MLGLVLFVIGRWTHLDTLNSIYRIWSVSDGQAVSVSVYARAPFISQQGYSLLSAGETNLFSD